MPKYLLILMLIAYFSGSACAADWKGLHEQADRVSLSDQLLQAAQNQQSVSDLYVLGLVYLNLHRDQDAQKTFENILSLDAQNVGAEWGLAEIMRRSHKAQESTRALERIIKNYPDFYPAYISLAYIKYREMDFNRAIILANQVYRAGESAVDRTNYVRSILILGGTKGMIAHYGGPLSKVINGTQVMSYLKKAQSIQPDSSGVFFGLGSFYLLAPAIAGGDLVKAKEYLEKAIIADPLFADAYVRLAQWHKINGDLAGYEKYLQEALKIDPQNEIALDIKNRTCKFICPDN